MAGLPGVSSTARPFRVAFGPVSTGTTMAIDQGAGGLCVFTDPPLARVGLNEVEAQRRGIGVRVATLPVQAILRTRTTGETRGFLEALVDARRDEILGFTMFGAEAGEVMAVVEMAMVAGMPFTRMREAIFTHPTMAEGLGMLFGQIGG